MASSTQSPAVALAAPEVPGAPAAPEHVDVLIVGAGLSGIGAACHLRRRGPLDDAMVFSAQREASASAAGADDRESATRPRSRHA